jgi:23S rRNA pseudouridine2605 synthase
MATEERLQKVLAKAGITSRRKAEELISEGLVTINGKVAKLGDKATFGKDAIKVKGKLIQAIEAPMYLAFYKPKGVISMLVDTENRPNLSHYLNKLEYRLFPVGRLDFMSEGLLLLTNDGDFAEKLQKRDDIARVYRIKVKGHLTDEMVSRLQKGARVENKVVRPHSVRVVRELEKKTQVDVVMVGAGAVDIKAMAELKGFLVDKITRTSIGHLSLHGLAPGHYRVLKASQVQALLDHPELGLKRIEHEEEAAKAKGQRNFHEKKDWESSDSDDTNDSIAVAKTPAPRVKPVAERIPVRRAGAAAKARSTSAGGARSSDYAPRDGERFERGERPMRGGSDRPSPRGPRPTFGDRPARGGDRPAFNDRPARGSDRPPMRGGDRERGPRRDSGFGAKPAFSASRGGDRPAWGRGFQCDGEKPRFGGDRKPGFGGGSDKPRFSGGGSDKPRFSGGGDRKPAFGGGDRKPAFGGGDRKPRFGGGRDRDGYGLMRPRADDIEGAGPGAAKGGREAFQSRRPPRSGDRPQSRGPRGFGGGKPTGGGFKPRRGPGNR